MALFQQSVIKKHISDLDENKLQQGWNHFESYFKDNAQQQKITDSKEEQFQYPFLDNLFDKCLGYTIDGSEQNLFTEFKNVTDSKKADGAIKINDEVVAVIELKSTKTKDFNKIQEQAFGYKVSHPNCKYVVTSNFNKLRFYIENATAFEEFDLFNLTYERFKLLWLCLSFESVSSGIPLKIKSESTLNEENITKKLYKDYSLFRKEIFNDIVEKNQQYDKLTLFNKTQKLLDRFLFIFFAEDRRLLPVNSISKIIEKWEDDIAYGDEKSLYTSFKLYFNLLNKGRPASAKREEIFAYNGGLFAPDDTLDSISIDDKLLSKHTKNLSTYDFESDVSVNILGHIFEHSLSEIEEIQNGITGVETDKTSSKRKKDGVFYTPSYITKYIVENTVGKLCQEKKEELEINEEVYTQRKARSKKRIDNLDAYRNWLLGITICDPACGSGAFLVQALDFLIEEHKYIDELNAAYHGASIPFSDITSSILENNLYGVDINGESVEIAKLSLWLRTAQKGRKLTSLNSNLKCGNSLIDDPEVAGDKAFNWENEFPEVFAKGGFDVVIGNPPYVRQELFKEIKPYLEQQYKCYNSVADLYTYFIEKGIGLMNERGLFSFILPNKFLKANYGKQIRKVIMDNSNLELLLDFDDYPVFSDATTYPIIYVLNRNGDYKDKFFQYSEISKRDKTLDPINTLEIKKRKVSYISLTYEMWSFIDEGVNDVLQKVNAQSLLLKELVDDKIFRGVSTGCNDVFIVSNETKKKISTSNTLRKIFLGREVKRYKADFQDVYLLFLDWNYDIEQNSELKEYLNSHRLKLEKRPEVKQGRFNWWCLSRYGSKNSHLLSAPKIIYPRINNKCNFFLDETGEYSLSDNNFFISSGSKSLLAFLNSTISFFFLKNNCTTLQGGYWDFRRPFIEKIPIHLDLSSVENQLEKLGSKQLIDNNKEMLLQKSFVRYFQTQYKLEHISSKLQNWHELKFENFVKELNKPIKKSNGNELDDIAKFGLMQLFDDQKIKLEKLKTEIDKTDSEIDQIIYKLYGLTQEEIEIVENATK